MQPTKRPRLGPEHIYLTLFVVLIASGIVAKRVYGHPNWMVFFHLPAAVFLVMGTHRLSAPFRKKYERHLRAWN